MRFFCWAFALLSLPLSSPPEPDGIPPHLALARNHIGQCEQGGNNRGAHPAKVLAAVGLDPGHAWCAAQVSYCLDAAGVLTPAVRSARARDFIDKQAIPAKYILLGVDSVRRGDILIWHRGTTPYGHIGFADADWQGSEGPSVEGNTSCGAGSIREGDCVCRKQRRIEPLKHFRITHIRRVTYPWTI